MSNQDGKPTSTSLIFPAQATTQGELAELKTEVKKAKGRSARYGLLSLVLGAFAVSGLVGAILMAWHSENLGEKAREAAEAPYNELAAELATVKTDLTNAQAQVEKLEQQNANFLTYRDIANTMSKISQVDERTENYFGLAENDAQLKYLKEDTDIPAWDFNNDNVGSDSWKSIIAQKLTAELKAREAVEEKVADKVTKALNQSTRPKVTCARANPFDPEKNKNCK